MRGEKIFRRVDDILAWFDGLAGRWLPTEYNVLAQAGAAANVALLVAVATGVLLLLWYSPSLQFAYPSLAAVHGRTFGGWVRAMHRYSSDLMMLLLIVHAGRMFIARKFAGARWLAWVFRGPNDLGFRLRRLDCLAWLATLRWSAGSASRATKWHRPGSAIVGCSKLLA